MIVNYQTDEGGRLESVTIYPLDMKKPSLELPNDFDLKSVRDYVLSGGALKHDPFVAVPSVAEQIAALKQKLADTDYSVIKIAEGAATAEEYADTIALRQEWRDKINALEAQEGGKL